MIVNDKGQVRVTVQYFRDNDPLGEVIAWIKADNEEAAVNLFLHHARIDLKYRFLGSSGFIEPSDKTDYLWKP